MKKLFIVIAGLVLAVNTAWGQDNLVTFQSPEAASLGIVGTIPVSYYTGRADISIPLMEIKSGDFTMPVTLSYNSGGILPDIHPTWVGQNWNLEVGGVITRTVRGLPDEIYTEYIINGYSVLLSGFHNLYSNAYNSYWNIDGTPDGWTNRDKMFKSFLFGNLDCASSRGVGTDPFNGFYHFEDTESDEYYISANGFSGKMIIGSDGNFHVIGHPDIKVTIGEIESINVLSNSVSNLYNTKLSTFKNFTVTMPNGIIYTYGVMNNDTDNTVETTYTRVIGIDTDTDTPPPCAIATSWMLTNIITPDNDTIKLSYKSVTDKIYSVTSRQAGTDEPYTDCNQGITYNYQDITHSYLVSIEGESFRLDFFSTKAMDMKIKSTGSSSYLLGAGRNWQKLDSIKLKNKQNQIIKRVNFTYNNDEEQRLYLMKLQESGKNPYVFDYNGNKGLKYNAGTDLWGYYNNEYSCNDNYPDISPALGDFVDYLPDCRKTDTLKIKEGMLKQIKYPTGGTVEFEFEANTYARISRMQIKSDSNPFEYDHKIVGGENKNNYAGGTRIKKIIYKNSDNTIENIKEYDYTKKFIAGESITVPLDELVDANNIIASSGILGVMPVLVYKFHYRDRFNIPRVTSGLIASAFTPSILTNGSYIGYSQVTEYIKDKNGNTQGHTVYQYTNFDTNPDAPPNITSYPGYYRDYYQRNRKEEEQGQLLSQTDYATNGKMVKQNIFTYSKIERSPFKGVALYEIPCRNLLSFTAVCLYEISNNSYLPSKKEEIFYDESGNETIKKIEEYEYDSNTNLIKSIKSSTSNGGDLVTKYVYPFEITSGSDYAVAQKMTNKNMLSEYIKKYTYKHSNNQVISGEYRKFAEYLLSAPVPTYNSLFIKPYRIDVLKQDEAITVTNIDNYFQPSVNLGYDVKGNIITVKDWQTDYQANYIWGYNHQYPIFKIENATFAKVKSVLGNSYPNAAFPFGILTSDIKTDLHFDKQIVLNLAKTRYLAQSGKTMTNTEVTLASNFLDEVLEQNYNYSQASIAIETTQMNAILKNIVINVLKPYIDFGDIAIFDPNILVGYDDENATLEHDIRSLGATLRTSLPDAWVWTYTYKPLVGITSITDPKGVTIYYSYDSAGRLIEIKDADGKKIESYDYHYKPNN